MQSNVTSGPDVITTVLAKNKAIKTLSMEYLQFGIELITTFGPALVHNRTITSLALCDSKIVVTGAEILASGLRSNTTVTELHLNDCDLSDSSAIVIVENCLHLKLIRLH